MIKFNPSFWCFSFFFCQSPPCNPVSIVNRLIRRCMSVTHSGKIVISQWECFLGFKHTFLYINQLSIHGYWCFCFTGTMWLIWAQHVWTMRLSYWPRWCFRLERRRWCMFGRKGLSLVQRLSNMSKLLSTLSPRRHWILFLA